VTAPVLTQNRNAHCIGGVGATEAYSGEGCLPFWQWRRRGTGLQKLPITKSAHH